MDVRIAEVNSMYRQFSFLLIALAAVPAFATPLR
jgi:hypothetical protein